MPPKLIIDPADLDLANIVADLDEIRRVNPQRHEMEALTAIVLLDPVLKRIAGYKDVTANEFWVRGHMPGMPLMPGVMMCEAAAQLCSYYLSKHRALATEYVGLGGLQDVQFRAPVRPGDRLVLVGQMTRDRRMLSECDIQGFVGTKMVFNALVQGVLMQRE